MTAKERIRGVFFNAESQIRFMQWFIGIGVVLSTTFSGLSYTRIEGMNTKYIEVKEDCIKTMYKTDNLENIVNEHEKQLDSINKRISILELTTDQIIKVKQLKNENNGN